MSSQEYLNTKIPGQGSNPDLSFWSPACLPYTMLYHQVSHCLSSYSPIQRMQPVRIGTCWRFIDISWFYRWAASSIFDATNSFVSRMSTISPHSLEVRPIVGTGGPRSPVQAHRPISLVTALVHVSLEYQQHADNWNGEHKLHSVSAFLNTSTTQKNLVTPG